MNPFRVTCLMSILTVVLTIQLATAMSAQVSTYSDSFEGPAISNFWTQTQTLGSIALSSEQVHGGTQAVKFSSVGGGQRDIHLAHTFPTATKGEFSVFFYDAAPGQETLYQQIYLFNSVTQDLAVIGTQDFDAFCYTAFLYNYNTTLRQGPNANCGTFPQISTTNVTRTAGWHQFVVDVCSTSISLSIDGTKVFTANGDYQYDSLTLGMSGPDFRPPNVIAYWDDFSFTPITSCSCGSGTPGPTGPQGPAGPVGPAGPAGPQGLPGPQGIQGPPVMFKGVWSSTTAYNIGDAVSFNGSSFIAISDNTAKQPDVSSLAWSLLAQQGTQGPAGAQGPLGPAGPQGSQGAPGQTGPQGATGPVGPIGPQGPAGPQGPPGPTQALVLTTVAQTYNNTVNVSCPSGYSVITASCRAGTDTVINAQNSPLITGSWANWLTPNTSSATGVHCSIGGGNSSTVLLRCGKLQ